MLQLHSRQRRLTFLFLSLGLMLTAISGSAANAKWFRKAEKPDVTLAKQIQTYQPPPDNALQLYCEPIRNEIVALSHKPKFLSLAYKPRMVWLMHEHEKCKTSLMEQERQYLKHVDIQQSPELPKIKTDATPVDKTPQAGDSNAGQL
jgi:hypothetical protein